VTPHDHHIPPSDPRYDGFRVTHLWAALAVDPKDNQEGVISDPFGRPGLASDERALDHLREFAVSFARQYRVKVRIVHFTGIEEVQVVDPQQGGSSGGP
jgi:hypothetical protein